MRRGDFGIQEPAGGPIRAARNLDIILTPLVAFDSAGNRIGMGGGYYDRTFAFLKRRTTWRKPKLIGIAFGLQEVDAVPVDTWDVPLDGILTEKGLVLFKSTNHRGET